MTNKELFVLKCGGSTLAALPDAFFHDLIAVSKERAIPVIVHGGGPLISETLDKLQIESVFVGGLRKTSRDVLNVVEMVLAGSLNKQIVAKLQSFGAKAVGLSGVDGLLLEARPVDNASEIGFVGDVISVNADLIRGVAAMGFIPVIAPVGVDASGQRYNINADTAAGAVASGLGASRMIVVTDVPGILRTIDGEKTLLPAVSVQEVETMIGTGEIYGGMIPKVRAALSCIHGRVNEVVIVSGTEPGVVGRVLAGETVGTRIVKTGM